jgi:hypothetical protein
MEFIAFALFTRILCRFMGKTCAIDPPGGLELHAIGFCNSLQSLLRPIGAGALHVLGQFLAFRRDIPIQIEWTPLQVDLVFILQPLDHTLADITPRSYVIRENCQLEVHLISFYFVSVILRSE